MCKIIEYPEMEGTLKDHGIPTPGLAQGSPNNSPVSSYKSNNLC